MSEDLEAKAAALVNGDRAKTYGHPKVNMKRIARLWDAYLQNLNGGAGLLPKDVAMMLLLVKVARQQETSTPLRDQPDTVIDMHGYIKVMEKLEE